MDIILGWLGVVAIMASGGMIFDAQPRLIRWRVLRAGVTLLLVVGGVAMIEAGDLL